MHIFYNERTLILGIWIAFFAQDQIRTVLNNRFGYICIGLTGQYHQMRRNFNFEHTYGDLREFDFFFTFSRSVLQPNLALRNFFDISKLFNNANLFTIY